jgi:Ca2+/H+ antiporter
MGVGENNKMNRVSLDLKYISIYMYMFILLFTVVRHAKRSWPSIYTIFEFSNSVYT